MKTIDSWSGLAPYGIEFLTGPSTYLTPHDLNNAGQAVGFWADGPEPWISGTHADTHDVNWKTLDMRALVTHPEFLQAGL